jgi:hypothetical protein
MPIMRLGWNSLIIKASSNALSLVIYNTFVRRNYDKLLAQIILLLLPFFFSPTITYMVAMITKKHMVLNRKFGGELRAVTFSLSM